MSILRRRVRACPEVAAPDSCGPSELTTTFRRSHRRARTSRQKGTRVRTRTHRFDHCKLVRPSIAPVLQTFMLQICGLRLRVRVCTLVCVLHSRIRSNDLINACSDQRPGQGPRLGKAETGACKITHASSIDRNSGTCLCMHVEPRRSTDVVRPQDRPTS